MKDILSHDFQFSKLANKLRREKTARERIIIITSELAAFKNNDTKSSNIKFINLFKSLVRTEFESVLKLTLFTVNFQLTDKKIQNNMIL